MSAYQQEWLEYKRIRNRFWLLFAGYLPVCFAIAKLFHTFIPAFVAAILWMGLIAIAGWRVPMWHCPRCGKWL
jgi:hypothetical protein